MKIKSNKFVIVNPFTKEIYDEIFDTKTEVEKLIISSRHSNLRVSSGRQINALVKSRNLNLSTKSTSELRALANRRDREEEERIKELKRRGLFYK